jgi:hypothetical protein
MKVSMQVVRFPLCQLERAVSACRIALKKQILTHTLDYLHSGNQQRKGNVGQPTFFARTGGRFVI